MGVAIMVAAQSPTPSATAQDDSVAKGTFKHLIKVGESGRRGYNSYNRGSTRCAASNKTALNISGMTLKQIAYYQALPACSANKLLAVGFYQDIDITRCKRALNLPDSTIYSPAIQDKCFALYLVGEKQPAIKYWITGGKNIKWAGHMASAEFAGLKSPILGRGYHDGNGNNKATVSAQSVLNALQNARTIYQEKKAAGASHEEAYTAALGVGH
jgi:hypothetical protein